MNIVHSSMAHHLIEAVHLCTIDCDIVRVSMDSVWAHVCNFWLQSMRCIGEPSELLLDGVLGVNIVHSSMAHLLMEAVFLCTFDCEIVRVWMDVVSAHVCNF